MGQESPRRIALVLSGGGARGAYEAGVLSYLFDSIYPKLPRGFEFDILSGTSVGAVHAAYACASAHLRGPHRAKQITEPWLRMALKDMLQVSVGDLAQIPLRALGLSRLRRRDAAGAEALGGLVDIRPLERLVQDTIPWKRLRSNLDEGRVGALCVSCTEVRSGRVTVFMDGNQADPIPWTYDPNAHAIRTEIDARPVRASAAIPFLFPAVRIGERYYVDGGLRMNTPLSPALRLGAARVLIVGLKHLRGSDEREPTYPEDVITQPVFLLGKVLDAMLLDQLEYEVHRISLVNALIEQGTKTYGSEFLENLNVAVRGQRGVDYRKVDTLMVRPSEDIGRVAADCYRRQGSSMGVLPRALARLAQRGVPPDEADLLSYLFFDRCFTSALVELGRSDARRDEDAILELLS